MHVTAAWLAVLLAVMAVAFWHAAEDHEKLAQLRAALKEQERKLMEEERERQEQERRVNDDE